MIFVFIIIMILNYSCITSTKNDVTVINRNILSRKKRYLVFPKGSVLVIQLSAIKAVQQRQPTGWNFLEELEYPFFLPDDSNVFRRKNRINRDRREIFSTLQQGLTRYGLDGNMCIKKMICDAQTIANYPGRTMISDIIFQVFNYSDQQFNRAEICTEDLETKCSLSIIRYFFEDIVRADE